jgi:hypothetical protein
VNDALGELQTLAARREAARRAHDFGTADALRARIREAGFDVIDTPSGPRLVGREAVATPVFAQSADVPSLLGEVAALDASIHWVVQGWPEDVLRGLESFRRHQGDRLVQHVVVEAAGLDIEWPDEIDLVRVDPRMGWAAARNAALRRTSGRVVMIVDGSVEATGDVLSPLIEALEDPTVGLTGPFGLVAGDLREFRESDGPEVDAVEGYLMAFRRELLVSGLRFDEKFKFYRSADVDLSFRIKAMGLRATMTPVPVRRHEHRMWANTAALDRDRLSKRNYYRFLDRFRGRTDLLVSPGGPGSPASRRSPGARKR